MILEEPTPGPNSVPLLGGNGHMPTPSPTISTTLSISGTPTVVSDPQEQGKLYFNIQYIRSFPPEEKVTLLTTKESGAYDDPGIIPMNQRHSVMWLEEQLHSHTELISMDESLSPLGEDSITILEDGHSVDYIILNGGVRRGSDSSEIYWLDKDGDWHRQ